jgi:hypothetical protein
MTVPTTAFTSRTRANFEAEMSDHNKRKQQTKWPTLENDCEATTMQPKIHISNFSFNTIVITPV